MSKQANKTMIGAFVVGAVVLVVGGVLMFGSGKFLQKRIPYVMYFESSVKGLDVGASVVWRGVKIGTVTDVLLRADPIALTFEIPVFIEVEPDRMMRPEDVSVKRTPRETMKLLIEKGLRAQLQMQSLVTGKLMVELDFRPEKPAKLHGRDPDYVEIPTIESDLAELAQRIGKVPIEEIFEKLHAAVEGIEKVINSPEVMEILTSFNDTLDAAEKLIENVDRHVDPLLTATEETVRDTQDLVRNVDGRVGTLAASAEGAIKSAAVTLDQASETLKSVKASTGDDSVLFYEINKTLIELSAAARSIRLLADYLNQHPESLLRGKGGSK
jgi:paraquat-inducible protein B